MKKLLLSDYKNKKFISDNIEKILEGKYIEISDEEYSYIDSTVELYNSYIQEIYHKSYDLLVSYNSSTQFDPQILVEIEQIKNDIKELKPDSYDVEESGLYYIDENGYIGAKITQSGLFAINIDSSGNSSNESNSYISYYNSVNSLNDLSDVLITDVSNGEALVYNSASSKWKNSSVSGSISGDFTLLDY